MTDRAVCGPAGPPGPCSTLLAWRLVLVEPDGSGWLAWDLIDGAQALNPAVVVLLVRRCQINRPFVANEGEAERCRRKEERPRLFVWVKNALVRCPSTISRPRHGEERAPSSCSSRHAT